jgi:fatty acid-binding protein DegV
VIILHADAPEDAARVESKLKEKIPGLNKIEVYYVGPVIGAHCGPGTVAVGFFGKERQL